LTTVTIRPDVYEFVKAEILSKTHIITPEHTFIRYDNFGQRNYIVIDGEQTHVFPSVTSVIHQYEPMSFGLKQFYLTHTKEEVRRILDETANYGTYMHDVFSRLLKGQNFNFVDEWLIDDMLTFYTSKGWDTFSKNYIYQIKQDILGFVCFAQDFEIEPIALEYPVFSIDKKYAGCIDMVGMIKNKNSDNKIMAVFDWKSGRNDFYDSYEAQLKAYFDAWNEMHPDTPAVSAFVYGCKDYRLPLGKTVIPYRFKEMHPFPGGWKWDAYLDAYHRDHPEFVRRRVDFAPIQVNLGTKFDEAVVEYDPIEQITETF